MLATFSNGDPALAMQLTNPQVGLYSTTWTPGQVGSQVRVTARANSTALGVATADIIGGVQPNKAPTLARNGVLGRANPVGGAPLAPGGAAMVLGSSLAAGVEVSSSTPLPRNLNGVTALVGGIEAPVYAVSPEQLQVQIPFELEPDREHSVVVSANGGITLPDSIYITAARPGLVLRDGNAAAQHADGSPVTADAPAQPGEQILIFAEGMGGTIPPVPSGGAAPPDPPAVPQAASTLTLDGQSVPILSARLTPGVVGIYQILFAVPAGAQSGLRSLVVTQGSAASNSASIPVK